MPANHEITIELDPTGQHARPVLELHVGQTVEFRADRNFKVKFVPWRFAEPEHDVDKKETLTAEIPGSFEYQCTIAGPNGSLVEYKSGGNGKVTKP